MALLLFLVCVAEKQIADQPIFLDGRTDPYAADYLYIGTPSGIYTYDRRTERWSRITRANGLPDNISTILGLDEGILWVATPGGLASADVKIHDWQTYDLHRNITGIAFDADHVWVSADSGLWRYDKYVETWEAIRSLPIQDITAQGGYIWCASDSGIFRFDRTYEKFERAPGAPPAAYGYILDTPQRLWFFGKASFAALEKEAQRWSLYQGFNLEDIAAIGDSLFAITESTLVLFDPAADTWTPYKDLSDVNDITGISTFGSEIYLTTRRGLLVYAPEERIRTVYTEAHGLATMQLNDVYATNNNIYVTSVSGIQYLDLNTGVWNTEKYTDVHAPGTRTFFIDEAGVHARLVPAIDTRLQGRAYYAGSWDIAGSTSRSDHENLNLKLISTHTSGRLLSVYYDDSDPRQLMYGFGYRGLEHDVVYRTNGGILGTEYYEFDLVPSFSYLGANAKLRAGDHGIDAQGGYLKSHVHTDFFTGTSLDKEFLRHDTQYAKYAFYAIFDDPQPATRSWDTIYVDDGDPLNNAIDTRRGYTVAGITGDYDILVNGIDYYIDYSRGVIRFLAGRDSTDIIVLDLGGTEVIIQSATVTDHMLENVYFLAPDILPHSLSISITDTAGMTHPLSAFGLDDNGDNVIDPAYVDYHLGYLTFPAARPFPDEVYETGLHILTMNVRCASRAAVYYLSYTPVLKMSETVYVDGEPATRGSDYIIDYTSGALIFLMRGLVNDFSDIEVQYSSVERDREDIFFALQPNITLGKNLALAPGFTSMDEQDIAHFSAKLDAGSNDKNIQFIPQVAYTTDSQWGQSYGLLANLPLLSINATYRGFSDSFDVRDANLRHWGTLLHQASISARIEPVRHVQCESRFREEIMTDSLGRELSARYIQGSVSYRAPDMPNGTFSLGRYRLPDCRKNIFQTRLNYSAHILSTRLNLYAMSGYISYLPDTSAAAAEYEYTVSGSVVLPIPISTTWYVRKGNIYEHDTALTRTDELRGNMNIDVIPGFYYTGSYDLEAESYILTSEQDLALQHYFYNTISIAPGRWYAPLSSINLMCGAGRRFDQYVSALALMYHRPLFLLDPVTAGSLSSINGTDTYYLAVQVNPLTGLVVWGKHTVSNSRTASYAIPEPTEALRDEIRIEFERRTLGFFSAKWDRKQYRTYPDKTTDKLFGEWIKPWTARLRTRLTADYYTAEDVYGQISTSSNELRSNFQTLVRFGSGSYVTLDIGGSRKEQVTGDIHYTIIPGAGFDISLFTGVYLQCAYEANVLLDSVTTHGVTARITGQF